MANFNKVDKIRILTDDNGTETLLLEFDEIGEAEPSSAPPEKEEAINQMEFIDFEKHGKMMNELFGNADIYEAFRRFRRNRVFGTFECPECKESFINTARLERHLSVHQVHLFFVSFVGM
ncbi:unnamed protein product [Gongylonema pulchrum]|uniref:C2H2-type domain-containing protein n=1 Tax=Gongylonema pulchrum TaxID=637853 RepID=A0A183DZR9_9BILA|nr:unnamed protein product [Gongylonema pulchrum]